MEMGSLVYLLYQTEQRFNHSHWSVGGETKEHSFKSSLAELNHKSGAIWLPASRGWAPSAVIITRSPAPWRRRSPVPRSFLPIREFNSHSATTQSSGIQTETACQTISILTDHDAPLMGASIWEVMTNQPVSLNTPTWYFSNCNSKPICLPAIQLPNRICGVSRILKLDKSKTGRIPSHPDATKGPVVPKSSLQLRFITIISQISNIDFTVQWAVTVHDGTWRNRENNLEHLRSQ